MAEFHACTICGNKIPEDVYHLPIADEASQCFRYAHGGCHDAHAIQSLAKQSALQLE